MPNTGPDFIDAIKENEKLKQIKDCPGVPAQMGLAVYGDWQDDEDPGIIITRSNMHQNITDALEFDGTHSDTAIWHLLLEANAPFNKKPIHHFVVVPWKDDSQEQFYTVFMAYENYYRLEEYINGKNGNVPPPGNKGYKPAWTPDQLTAMLTELLTTSDAWQQYMGQVGAASTTKITCWKYSNISLETAISNVRG